MMSSWVVMHFFSCVWLGLCWFGACWVGKNILGRTVLKRWSLVFYGTEEDVDLNANYTDKDGKQVSTLLTPGQPNAAKVDGYSSYVLYTPRNSSDMFETKGESGGGSSLSGSGTGGGRNKSGRPRIKGKLISKKQKGATSATPTVKSSPSSHPAESHVIITSDDEEFRQFLQSKFGLVRMSTSFLGGGGQTSSGSNNAGKRNFGNWSASTGVSGAHALVPITLHQQSEPKDEARQQNTPLTSFASSSSSTSTMTRASVSSVSSSTSTSSNSSLSSLPTAPPLEVNLNSNANNLSSGFSAFAANSTNGGTTERSSSGSNQNRMLASSLSESFARNVANEKIPISSSPLPQSKLLANQSHAEQGFQNYSSTLLCCCTG